MFTGREAGVNRSAPPPVPCSCTVPWGEAEPLRWYAPRGERQSDSPPHRDSWTWNGFKGDAVPCAVTEVAQPSLPWPVQTGHGDPQLFLQHLGCNSLCICSQWQGQGTRYPGRALVGDIPILTVLRQVCGCLVQLYGAVLGTVFCL